MMSTCIIYNIDIFKINSFVGNGLSTLYTALLRPILTLLTTLMYNNYYGNITQDTVLNSISAGVLFSLAVGLATVIDAHATLLRNIYSSRYYDYDYDYDSQYPSTVPGNAAAVSAVDYHCMMSGACMRTIQFLLNCRPLDSWLRLLS